MVESVTELHRIQTNTTRMDREVMESEAERDPTNSDLFYYTRTSSLVVLVPAFDWLLEF